MNKKLSSKYILFDLDGTIIASDPGITMSIKYALEKNSMVSPTLEELKVFVGPPLQEKFREVFGISSEEADKLISYYRERYNTIGKYECNVYDGIKELLEVLKSKGKVLAVATSKPEKAARDILNHFSISEYFDFIGGDTPNHDRKDKTAVINYVMNELGAKDTSEVIMVGDTHYDVIGARNSGVECIGVLYGYDSKEDLEDSKPFVMVENPLDILSVFE